VPQFLDFMWRILPFLRFEIESQVLQRLYNWLLIATAQARLLSSSWTRLESLDECWKNRMLTNLENFY